MWLKYKLTHIYEGRSDVDSVGVFLAQRLVLFGEERLTFQISGADLWWEPKTYRVMLLSTQHSQHLLSFGFKPCCRRERHRLLDLPHTRSRCHARWILGLPGTCPPPRLGSHSRGSWSQTGCSSLSEQSIYKMLFCLQDFHDNIWLTSLVSPNGV